MKTEMIQVRVEETRLRRIDKWRKKKEVTTGLELTMADAVRSLIDLGLAVSSRVEDP
jgi:hypothetical protein